MLAPDIGVCLTEIVTIKWKWSLGNCLELPFWKAGEMCQSSGCNFRIIHKMNLILHGDRTRLFSNGNESKIVCVFSRNMECIFQVDAEYSIWFYMD